MNDKRIHINKNTTKVTYKVFEDNSRALEMANINKFFLRINCINVKLHYFCNYITKGAI